MKIAFIDPLGLTYDGSTLKKHGLGGSESAVILLSKELTKLGFQVTVYNNCIDKDCQPGKGSDGVTYIDHTMPIEKTTYDICVLSRSVTPVLDGSRYQSTILASKYKVLWMHDTFCQGDEHIETLLRNGGLDRIFTLSDFQSTYVTTTGFHGPRRNYEVLKHKFWQTRNGAVRYDVDYKNKDWNQFVYNASATKGMTTLVERYWPKIKQIAPNAHLKIIGGFYRFKGGEPDEQEKMVRRMAENPRNKELGIDFMGVISQKEIAKILGRSNMMLYPTEFPETFGISTLESLLYQTPLITNRFGALEETAVDLACFKIDYSSTKNSVYAEIDEDHQEQVFLKTFAEAYNNPYLVQQKRNYCDVVQDIAGWDTVALQWKQHFFNQFGWYFPVDEYRKVDRINEKVHRIFGRRYENDETRKTYKCYSPEREIIVVSPVWNARDYIVDHIYSVVQQDYTNYKHHIIDDCSDDGTFEIAERLIAALPSETRKKFILTRTAKQRGAAANHHAVLMDYQDQPGKIIMLLDGDDSLVNNNTIFKYYNDLYDQGYDFTYGSMWSLADNIPLVAQDYSDETRKNKSYRNEKFNWGIPYTHLRTFSSGLIKDIDWDKMKKPNGEWMMSGHDNPLFYETIKSAHRPKAVKDIMVKYNDVNPLNDYKINAEEQNENAGVNVQKTLTKALEKTLDFKDNTMKQILIAIPTNKYIETDTFKSIYNLKLPKGYETRFECFYGYRVDQVRNLIAEWGKNYDYVLSVDSDIVLPPDTLEKMLWLDKDIISGIYIQRIPGTHTIEIFEDNNGGMKHMDWKQLEKRGITEVAGCGMGACLIKGEVFRGMEYPHYHYTPALNHNETFSEDTYFCKKARESGFKVWADPSIICDHIGQTMYQVNLSKVPELKLESGTGLYPKKEKVIFQ